MPPAFFVDEFFTVLEFSPAMSAEDAAERLHFERFDTATGSWLETEHLFEHSKKVVDGWERKKASQRKAWRLMMERYAEEVTELDEQESLFRAEQCIQAVQDWKFKKNHQAWPSRPAATEVAVEPTQQFTAAAIIQRARHLQNRLNHSQDKLINLLRDESDLEPVCHSGSLRSTKVKYLGGPASSGAASQNNPGAMGMLRSTRNTANLRHDKCNNAVYQR
jgi:hypothetical protein